MQTSRPHRVVTAVVYSLTARHGGCGWDKTLRCGTKDGAECARSGPRLHGDVARVFPMAAPWPAELGQDVRLWTQPRATTWAPPQGTRRRRNGGCLFHRWQILASGSLDHTIKLGTWPGSNRRRSAATRVRYRRGFSPDGATLRRRAGTRHQVMGRGNRELRGRFRATRESSPPLRSAGTAVAPRLAALTTRSKFGT